MAQPIIQASFNSGEWAPSLNARVDVAKYHSGATLLENFFVDYRGGATASPGTQFITQTALYSAVRLIPFQASLAVSYILEFGDGYVHFIHNGVSVLTAGVSITGITNANPAVVTAPGHGLVNGNRVYIGGVVGMTAVNNDYYAVGSATANTYTLLDVNGNPIDTRSFPAYTGGGISAPVYGIGSPYTAAELPQLKYAQNVSTMILCHPNHPPYQLVMTSATQWTFSQITLGSTVAAPSGPTVSSTLGAGSVNYAYVVTAVDQGGQESGPSNYATIINLLDMRTTGGTNTVTWPGVSNAASYNVYKAEPRYSLPVPGGSMFGFVGNSTSTTFIDSNIEPDFSSGPPVTQNPLSGSGVQSITITGGGSYNGGSVFPVPVFSGGGGSGAAGLALGQATSVGIVGASPLWASIGDTITLNNGVIVQVTSLSFTNVNPPWGSVNGLVIINPGSISSGSILPNPQEPVSVSTRSGQSLNNGSFMISLGWSVSSASVTSPGSGYVSAPTVNFSPAGATAIATLTPPPTGTATSAISNPTVPGFFQQRLVLAGPVSNPQRIDMSQPGAYYNFNVTNPIAPDNAFSGSLVSGTLNTIQSVIPQPQGLIVLSDQAAWLVNGGSAGAPISAVSVVANSQVFAGAAGLPPIAAVDNILYVQSKNSIVRDLVFNFQKQVYTGSDISILSSHLFYGYSLVEWAWAEEPFKIVYAIRNDGVMLTLTFLKEQELVAWSHRTTNGSFKSIATVTEQGANGLVNAVYVTVQRVIEGATVLFIERFVEQYYPIGATDAWQVDSGLRYSGGPSTSFTGGRHLSTFTVTGLATDNLGRVTVVPPFVMSHDGSFTLTPPPSPATGYIRVTIGIPYTPKLKTLGIDTGNPTIQGKMKKLPEVTLRVNNTLGLSIGTDFDNLVNVDDLIVGNIGKDTNQLVTDLVTGDAKQALDPAWTVPGQYCIQQSLPYPATILGLIPQIAVGDTPDRGGK